MAEKAPATRARGMDAVVEKTSGKRTPVMKRKSPGIAIMIAVGKPKPGHDGAMGKGEGKGKGKAYQGKPKGTLAERVAALEAHCYGEGSDDGENDTEDDD